LGPKAKSGWLTIKEHMGDAKEDSSVRNHLIRLTGVFAKNSAEANNYAEASNLFDVTPFPFADLAVSSLITPSAAARASSAPPSPRSCQFR
jgi:hypothetical protein